MTEQSERWGDDFGEQYSKRNPNSPEEMQALYQDRFGIERTGMNEQFLTMSRGRRGSSKLAATWASS